MNEMNCQIGNCQNKGIAIIAIPYFTKSQTLMAQVYVCIEHLPKSKDERVKK